MRKLRKNHVSLENSVEAYFCSCACTLCNCNCYLIGIASGTGANSLRSQRFNATAVNAQRSGGIV